MDDTTEIFKQREMKKIMLSEDGTLKYDFMFSLQKIAMAKIASNLWMNQINQEEEIAFSDEKEIKDTFVAKVSQLFLPNHISQQLQDIVTNFGESIFTWINYHDDHLFCSKESRCYALDFINNIMWTVRGRIDYGQTAKNILASQDSCLSDDIKYKLACMYCLEEEIAVLAPKIIVNEFYFSGVAIDQQPMVYFWTAHFTRDNTPINNPYYSNDRIQRDSNMSINEYIMVLLMNDHDVPNDIPIRYMWNKLNEKEKAKHIVALVEKVHNLDLILSLLSNIQYDLQQKVFKECSSMVLYDILNDWWWWGEYFLPTLLHIFDIMAPDSYWEVLNYTYTKGILKFEAGNRCMYIQFKSLFKQLWKESSVQFKEFNFHLETGSYLEWFLTHILCWEQDTDIFELILNDLSMENKKKILSENWGISICANLIQNDKWNLLELFLKDAISSEDDVSELKERLLQEKGSEIAIHFLKGDSYDKLKHFISWAFKSKEDIWKLFKH